MKPLPVRLRLTVWYTAIFACAAAAGSYASYWTVQRSLRAAVDEELTSRVEGTRHFLETQLPTLSRPQLMAEFEDHLVVAMGPSSGPMQVWDGDGHFIYQAHSFRAIGLPAVPTSTLPAAPVYEDRMMGGHPLRMVTARLDAQGHPFGVQVAAVTADNERAIASLEALLLGAAPLLLLVAAGGGYYISSRALRPVAIMTQTARSISTGNLDRRVPVPPSRDELSALADTLNSMFDRLEAAFSRVAQFTGDASHELRSPVAFIRTAADIALRSPRTPEEYQRTLAEVQAEAERMSVLVDDLLTLTRSDSATGHLAMERLDLCALLHDSAERARALARAHDLEFFARLPLEHVFIDGNPDALRRLTIILTDNAVRYTPAPGLVEWRLSREAGTAVFEVIDSGIGIEPADLPHVFERFYRADRARHRDTGGTGLGLPIARWIVEEHAGTISAQSNGRGSCFRLTLALR